MSRSMRLAASVSSGAVCSIVPSRSMTIAEMLRGKCSGCTISLLWLLYFGQLGAQRGNHSVVAVFVAIFSCAKHRTDGYESIHASFSHFANVGRAYAAVDFQTILKTGCVDHLAYLARLVQYVGNEFLSAEAGVHRHQQHHIQFRQRVFQYLQRRGRVEHQTGLATAFLDQANGAVDMLRSLRVKSDVSRARLGEIGNDAIHRLDHQMHVDRSGHAVLAQRFADQGTYGQIWESRVG